MTPWQMGVQRAIGAGLCGLVMLLGLGLFSHLISDKLQVLGAVARLTEGVRVYMLLASVALSLGLMALGARWIGRVGALVGLVGLAVLLQDYHNRIAPRGTASDLVVLWFNLRSDNPVAPETLMTAFAQSGADVIALAEAGPLRPAIAALQALYPHRIGCQEETSCNLLILSKVPIELIKLRPLQSGPERLARFTVTFPERAPVTIVAAHMIKPWYQSMSHKDRWALHPFLRLPSNPGPLLMLGDFNAAPWSRRMQTFAQWYELTHPRWPVATWPAALGSAGVPIDHILMRGGLGLTRVRPWGQGLGSNHRGLMAEIEIPPVSAPSDGPAQPSNALPL